MIFELFMALKYLRAKRREGFISLISFLSVAGVAVGVMALVIVIAVMSGVESQFRNKILGFEPHIWIMNASDRYGHYSDITAILEKDEKIKKTASVLFVQAMLKNKTSLSGVMLRGINPDEGVSFIPGFSQDRLKKALSSHHQNNNRTDLPGIILGKNLAASAGVFKGDTVVLMSSDTTASPIGWIPLMKRFVVTEIFESGMVEYDSLLAYVHLNQAQKLVKAEGKISAIGIWLDDVFQAKKVSESSLSFLQYPFYVRNWMDINQSFFFALKLEKTAMFIILVLIILVAAFNISSTLIMLIMEKTRDIALLKVMGATNKVIRRIFIIKGMLIAFTGTIVGTLIGIGVCMLLRRYNFIHLPEIYPFSTLPVQLEFFDVLMTAVCTICICFLSTLYPAYKASHMNTVEAMRYG